MDVKKLEETKLWQIYQAKIDLNNKRGEWVKEVYEAAINYLKDVRQTFKNYTLHDETHVINVMNAISGLLGDEIEKLTVGELELIILAASLHDIGMVYTDEEKQQCYDDEIACKNFLRTYCPELQGCPIEDWSEDTRQWYLRTLHPFRIHDVLKNKVWNDLLDRCPLEVVPKRCILAVCQAHGEGPKELRNNPNLEYLPANDASPLFCALLLRLGDLLDFDDTRAPKVLYSYVTHSEQSRMEWDKHQASAGFRYPTRPSANDLPYKARCSNPGVEHAIRDFLDWIDTELGNCIKLQKQCKEMWQQEFPFPRAVSRDEIESDGYESGDFCLTMDQEQILKLLIGENLYDNEGVFVRELLQNAVDATLLRGEMDPDFNPEKSRIDLWEWNDKEGYTWFRIDDQGTGMTLGMLKRYFLKVGNSYYTSKELERDLRDHGQTHDYRGNSRFGIGFLSSFLCGDYVEVSTLYYDPNKNRREELADESYHVVHYGLRMQVTGLTGYFTLKNQAKMHQIDEQLMAPEGYAESERGKIERQGYRVKPGTSIVIRLNPGKLGALDLRKVATKYLCGTRVPIYYNNEHIGQTYEEMMQEVHELAGEKCYELTEELKKQFDSCFPNACGQYPKIVVTVTPLDAREAQPLEELSGVLTKYEIRFDKEPQWKVKDQLYKIRTYFRKEYYSELEVILTITHVNDRYSYYDIWEKLKRKYAPETMIRLEKELEKYSSCPSEEQLGDAWKPFSEYVDLYVTWKAYCEYQQQREMSFPLVKCGVANTERLLLSDESNRLICAYKGIVSGKMNTINFLNNYCVATFLLGDKYAPEVEVSRSKILTLPLIALVTISCVLKKYQMDYGMQTFYASLRENSDYTLKEWRTARTCQLEKWMYNNFKDYFAEMQCALQKDSSLIEKYHFTITNYSESEIMYKYLMSYLQDKYYMTVNYQEGQRISFLDKKEDVDSDIYDVFPTMMFCDAANDESRQYICNAEISSRRCITADHPFIVWLLKNSVKLNQYYKRQFRQIINCLCKSNAEEIVKECNYIREQLLALSEHHGVDVRAFPQLSMKDFWQQGENE